MGHISNFDIDYLIRTYGLQYFVETGTGRTESLVHMVNYYPMRAYYSCEYDQILADAAKYALREAPDVYITHGRSTKFLPYVLSYLNPERPILFWLDAHFPEWVGEDQPQLYLPLADEVRIIAEMRPKGRDVICIDDMSIYCEADFQKPLPDSLRSYVPQERGMKFIEDAFGTTHDMVLRNEEGGLLLLTPKRAAPEVASSG